MSPKIIVSYDDTDNDRDALALGRLLAVSGAELSLAYVRHQSPTSATARRSREAGRGAPGPRRAARSAPPTRRATSSSTPRPATASASSPSASTPTWSCSGPSTGPPPAR